jgi:RimJ/RimL family protein N-acetyltransferase
MTFSAAQTPVSMPLRIETPRLVLRQFVHADWPAMYAHYSDIECTQFTFRRALTEGESWRAMASMVGHWTLHGYGPYAVQDKASGQVMGAAGLWYPNDWPEPEIKWALTKVYWGKGYAKEAARAVQTAASKNLPHLRLISQIHADNTASIQLALSLGCALEKEVEFRGAKHHIYRHSQAVKTE